MSTEIYICKPGQALKEGKVEYADIDSRLDAEDDAKYRCNADRSIAKIAYYKVSPDGDFRCFYTHQGEAAGQKPPQKKTAVKRKRVKPKKTKKKVSWWRRLFGG